MSNVYPVQTRNWVTDALLEAMARLASQLKPGGVPPNRAFLHEIVGTPTSILYMAVSQPISRDSDWLRLEPGDYLGTTTLVLFPIPIGGYKGQLEDVVVDESVRRRGIGTDLGKAAIDQAKRHGVRRLELHSNPERNASDLYLSLGFEKYDTDVFRLLL